MEEKKLSRGEQGLNYFCAMFPHLDSSIVRKIYESKDRNRQAALTAVIKYDETKFMKQYGEQLIQRPQHRRFSITVKKGDLFTSSDSLFHCVSVDLKMGAGIARRFKTLFGGVDELKAQCVEKGDCTFLQRGNRLIFYLVTKQRYWHKPSYENVWRSLVKLRELCQIHNITKLSAPLIAAGLDRLRWKIIMELITRVFETEPIKISIYKL